MLISTHTTSNSQHKSKGHKEYFNPNKRQEPSWLVISVQGTKRSSCTRKVRHSTKWSLHWERDSHSAGQKIPPTLHGAWTSIMIFTAVSIICQLHHEHNFTPHLLPITFDIIPSVISFSTRAFPSGCHTVELAKCNMRIHYIKMCPEALSQLWQLDASFSLRRWFHAMPVMNKVRCSS
jgi:hypothetical protein